MCQMIRKKAQQEETAFCRQFEKWDGYTIYLFFVHFLSLSPSPSLSVHLLLIFCCFLSIWAILWHVIARNTSEVQDLNRLIQCYSACYKMELDGNGMIKGENVQHNNCIKKWKYIAIIEYSIDVHTRKECSDAKGSSHSIMEAKKDLRGKPEGEIWMWRKKNEHRQEKKWVILRSFVKCIVVCIGPIFNISITCSLLHL